MTRHGNNNETISDYHWSICDDKRQHLFFLPIRRRYIWHHEPYLDTLVPSLFCTIFSIKLSIFDQKSVLTCAMWAHSYYFKESVFKLHALYSKMILNWPNFQAKSQKRVRIILKRYLYCIIIDTVCIIWSNFFWEAVHIYLTLV